MKARALSDPWRASILVWATGATLAGALYLALSQQPMTGQSLAQQSLSTSTPTFSGLIRPIPPRQVVTRTRAS